MSKSSEAENTISSDLVPEEEEEQAIWWNWSFHKAALRAQPLTQTQMGLFFSYYLGLDWIKHPSLHMYDRTLRKSWSNV